MLRSIAFPARLLATSLLCSAAVGAQADRRPIVVVFTFDNSSIGDKRNYEGLSTGIQDLLITDLASNAKVRLIDRSRIAEILREQDLIKAGQVDAQSAVRIGHLLGAQYAITGGFMADNSGEAILTSHTINIETSEIGNPEKIVGKADEVLGMIGRLSSKIAADIYLAPRQPSNIGIGDPTGTGTLRLPNAPPNPARPPNSETYAKVLPGSVVEKTMKTKLDAAAMKVYSRALDEMDAKNNAKAAELLRQIVAKYPDFEPAQRNLSRLSSGSGS
jgi:TolB-like protein